ncbi:MAG: TatD DNase family protein [Candidatus Azotimanducaceae bacterium]|jgi:TatD DNase family protein
MPTELYDAHCHSQHRLTGARNYVVNGTSPSDWTDIIELAAVNEQVIPAIGLHPWKIKDAPADWQARFLEALPQVQAVGEIGLDQWIEGDDIERQKTAFRWQLEKTTERNLPVSIHCLKASEALLSILKNCPLPARGIHLHAYSGSAQQVKTFADLGAYFSFHAGQFKANAKKIRAAVCEVPADRLLIETDAPDTLQQGDNSVALLQRGYDMVTELRSVPTEQLTEQVADNFKRYFLDD